MNHPLLLITSSFGYKSHLIEFEKDNVSEIGFNKISLIWHLQIECLILFCQFDSLLCWDLPEPIYLLVYFISQDHYGLLEGRGNLVVPPDSNIILHQVESFHSGHIVENDAYFGEIAAVDEGANHIIVLDVPNLHKSFCTVSQVLHTTVLFWNCTVFFFSEIFISCSQSWELLLVSLEMKVLFPTPK